MERIEKLLYDASIEGNLTRLQMLIQEDPLILDKVTLNHYDDMPLHIASMLGHIDFVKEILIRKPELSMEYDSQRRLPLHIAAAKGHVEIVEALVSAKPETCLACDRDGRNAIHLAAIRGRYEVVKELMRAQPHAARAMVQHDTILHLCVKYNQLEVLKFLVETMSDHEFLNSGDADGNTLLHLAVADKQIETVNFLVRDTTIEVDALNTNGEPSIEMLSQGPKDVKDQQIIRSLTHVGAPDKEEKEGSVGQSKKGMSFDHIYKKLYTQKKSKTEHYLENKRNTLMIVATFVAAVSFQANMCPPGGVWQDTMRRDTTATYNFNQTGTTQTGTTPIDAILNETTATNPDDYHQAGYAIMQTYNEPLYHIFKVANTLGFVSTTSIVWLLIAEVDYVANTGFLFIMTVITFIATVSMSVVYTVSMWSLSPDPAGESVIKWIVACIFIVAYLVAAIIFGAHRGKVQEIFKNIRRRETKKPS